MKTIYTSFAGIAGTYFVTDPLDVADNGTPYVGAAYAYTNGADLTGIAPPMEPMVPESLDDALRLLAGVK